MGNQKPVCKGDTYGTSESDDMGCQPKALDEKLSGPDLQRIMPPAENVADKGSKPERG
jgi:hypothetical protein